MLVGCLVAGVLSERVRRALHAQALPVVAAAFSEGCGAKGIKSPGTKTELAVTWTRGDTLLARRG